VEDLIYGNSASDFLTMIIKITFSTILETAENLVRDDKSLLIDLVAGAEEAASCVVNFILN